MSAINAKTLCLIVFVFISLSSFLFSSSLQIQSDSNKRISIPISSDSTNRIAFTNDRISQVFGDEEAYTLQSDETRGQIFLKPSEANGDKPIAITLTTEQNVVQDLELLPQKITTRTIILKGESKNDHQSFSNKQGLGFGSVPGGYLGVHNVPYQSMNGHHSFHAHQPLNQDYTSHLVNVLKQVVCQETGALGSEEESLPDLQVPELTVEKLGMIHTHGFKVSVYRLTNTKEPSYEIVENAFSGPIDGQNVLAIALEKNQLDMGESTRLFVVRRL